ncbi:hypothetical protein RSK20926_07748 [Roseobacter sp. SK209-2-6]|uniref:DUF1330 domain-containing protein n=1 Tax=Roseobacter sp. SK209-2-6 TaxID=388739 RepID=UPI0000F3F473|nr:DUF1330 domain-containing protein [Roseobacter sp. SK209-2-6]EBA14627.1 hypothetical protein RSK20926_07748 [Roseobacter sp. SK209-2-6]
MPKAYWIAHVTITDPQAYAGYQAVAPAAFQAHGAKFLARGVEAETLEGDPWQRHVVIEFGSMEEARACYQSPEYVEARSKRVGACEASITLVEGLG